MCFLEEARVLEVEWSSLELDTENYLSLES